MVLEELDDVSQPVSQLRGASHVCQHAEEVRARDPLAADVGEQVGVVGRLAQDDFGVVGVEVHLVVGGTGVTKMVSFLFFFFSETHRFNERLWEFLHTCRVPLLKSMTRACSVLTHWSSRGGGPVMCSSQSRSPP